LLLVPIIGVISAAPIVGEPIGVREIVALLLTLGGVFLAVHKPISSN
jgi:drug/metabolite transporter (DMT)-like permease